MTIRVFLLDDHELVRGGDLLWAEEDLTVVGDAATADEALERIPQTRPDVAVLDVRLGDGSGNRGGIEVCREIRSAHPEVACVMLTSYADDEALPAAILAGAVGYILKEIRGGDLVDAIRRVGRGESLLDPTVTARVLDRVLGMARRSEAAAYAATLARAPTLLRAPDLAPPPMTSQLINDRVTA